MKTIKTTTKTGVVAELDGKYYGVVYEGGGHGDPTTYGFGEIENAKVSDPKYCKKATDLTYEGSYMTKTLARAVLVPVVVTTTYELVEQ